MNTATRKLTSRRRAIAATPRTLGWYRQLVAELDRRGFGEDVVWSEGLEPVADADTFWQEFAWVVLNSGMKNAIARGIWRRVRPAVEAGHSAGSVFGHKGKSEAIDFVFANRERLLAEYRAAADKLEFLRGLPWIGEITCWHLAKNYGLDVAKPDRHLVRVAGEEGTHALCARLAKASGHRVATVDLVIWRAASIGIIDSSGKGTV